MKQAISININGVDHAAEVEPRLLLVHYLRDVLGLTGTHIGCETSICGACTVLVDGQAAKSCTILAVQADGCNVTPSRDSRPMANCIRCRKGSGKSMACSAVTARRE